MTFIEKIKQLNHSTLKEKILIILTLTLVFYQSIFIIVNTNFINSAIILHVIFTIALYILQGGLIILFEYKKMSLVSHFFLLYFFVGNSLPTFIKLVTHFSIDDYFNILINLLGSLMAIYASLIIFVNLDKIKIYQEKLSQAITILLTLTLITVFFNFGFNSLIIYTFLFMLILFTGREKDTLYLVIFVFITQALSNLNSIMILFINDFTLTDLITNIFNFTIDILIIYFAYNQLKRQNYHSEYIA